MVWSTKNSIKGGIELPKHHMALSKTSEASLMSGEECGCVFLINSEMTGLKLGGLIKGMWRNVLIRVRGGIIQDS